MPPKDKIIRQAIAKQPWIDKHEDDRCLYELITAAYTAREYASRAGASASALTPGDDALKQIKGGVVKDEEAWESARAALRRFSEANGAASGWAGRRPGHSYGKALRRRYGHTWAGGAKVHIGKAGPGTMPVCGRGTSRTSGMSTSASEFARESPEARCVRCEKKLSIYLRLAAKAAS